MQPKIKCMKLDNKVQCDPEMRPFQISVRIELQTYAGVTLYTWCNVEAKNQFSWRVAFYSLCPCKCYVFPYIY